MKHKCKRNNHFHLFIVVCVLSSLITNSAAAAISVPQHDSQVQEAAAEKEIVNTSEEESESEESESTEDLETEKESETETQTETETEAEQEPESETETYNTEEAEEQEEEQTEPINTEEDNGVGSEEPEQETELTEDAAEEPENGRDLTNAGLVTLDEVNFYQEVGGALQGNSKVQRGRNVYVKYKFKIDHTVLEEDYVIFDFPAELEFNDDFGCWGYESGFRDPAGLKNGYEMF